MHLVESFGSDSAEVGGRTFPVPSLVEDSDGLRWYLADSLTHIYPAYWARAVAEGASALLVANTASYFAMTTEHFMDQRDEREGHYVVREADWREFDQPPGYTALLEGPVRHKGFVHLHTHSEYSPLDGLSTIPQIIEQVTVDNQFAVGLTDHGICSGHPRLQREADKAKIKPIFGIEAYFCDDRLIRPEPKDAEMQKRLKDGYHHLILLAQNQVGLHNIWAMSTESYRDGHYYRPRMDWDTLARHSEGVVATTACLRGPLAVPILDGDETRARVNLARLLDIFGDRLYMELHANSMPEQMRVNEALISMAYEHSVPLLAVVDSHYPTKDAVEQHRAWIACQTNSDVQDETDLFAHDIGLYVQSEAEVRANLSYLPEGAVDEAIANTVHIAESSDARIEAEPVRPVFSKKGGPERDEERLLDLCLSHWDKITGKRCSQAEYEARFEHEFPLIASKGFCGYFLQVADYCRWAKEQGILVGPGRGSGGGSLVAYLCGITEIDPVEADLLFERFMTEGRVALPDFDVDFPTSKRDVIQGYIAGKYGEDRVVRVGTHTRVKNKGIIRTLGTAMKSRLPESAFRDIDAISKVIDEAESGTAGLGLSWEELWAQEEEVLAPYADRYPELFEMADHLVGRLKTYGKHPAGLVVSTDHSLVDHLPLRGGEDHTQMISQFEMGDLEEMGYIKFDILTLRTLDTIQEAMDLIEKRREHRVNIYEWKDEYLDPQVWDEISAGHTLGVFQVETASGVRICKQVEPHMMAEMSDALTLVRPGPSRSGLRDLYLARRRGAEPVSFPDARLEQVLAKTYGTLLYQEDIMATCMILAGYDSTKADEVRKILGKKQVEKTQAAGQEFVRGCVENGMDRDDAEHLWDQMAEFAKYSFGRAHAFGYAVLAYWTAWLKIHYPVEFFTSILSTVKQERIPEFVTEARRLGFQVLPPEINESGRGFESISLGVRYGLESIKNVGVKAVDGILAGQPYTSFEDFRERSGANAGVTAVLARVGAFDNLVPNRRGLEQMLLDQKTGDATKCVHKDETVKGPNDLPCTFDWENEPYPINPRTGKKLKRKPIVKKCTKACRNYTAPPPLEIATVEPYTPEDIREIEMEMLGIYLSSTPFDRIDPKERELLIDEVERLENASHGEYLIGGIISRIRKTKDRNQNEMAFLNVVTEKLDLDVTVFSKSWQRYQPNIRQGVLAILEVNKNSRGQSLLSMETVS